MAKMDERTEASDLVGFDSLYEFDWNVQKQVRILSLPFIFTESL